MDPNHEKYIQLVKFIEENTDNIYRIAYSYVKNQQTALDIVQDSIYKGLSSYRTVNDWDHIKNWFFRIVVNTSINHIKRQKRIVLTDQIIAAPPETDISHEDRIRLYDAIDQLKPNEKTVIILRYFEDRKIADIAFITGANINTVKSRLYSALNKLSGIMAQ